MIGRHDLSLRREARILALTTVAEFAHSIAMRFRPMYEIPGFRTLPLDGLPRAPLLFAVEAEKLDEARGPEQRA